jgi:hypothetical protein
MSLDRSPCRRRRLPRLAGTAALLGLLLVPTGAAASQSERTIFDATSSLIGASAKERKSRLNELDSIGVDTVRLTLQWRSFAPAPGKSRKPARFNAADPRDYPRGAFSWLDAAIRGIRAREMRVLLTPSAPIPDWASASGSSRLAYPKPAEFKRFVAALGRRYSGDFRTGAAAGPGCVTGSVLPCPPRAAAKPLPRVTFWAAWSEPNQEIFLRPQYRHGRPFSPRLYRRLFLAAQAGLAASGHGKDPLLIGETAPSGGRDGVDPLDFLRGVLCLDGDYHRSGHCRPIDARGWSHHPYGVGLAPYERSNNKGLINLATIDRMARALRKAAAAGATDGRLGLYVTEYGIQSRPGGGGVSLKRQAAYLAISEYMTWTNPRIRSYAQYLLRDDPPQYEFSFTTGLRLHGGRAKPALRSFPLTLLAKRNGSRVRIWGHVRPEAGPYRVEVRYRNGAGRSHKLRTLGTDKRGYFSFRTTYRAGRRWGAKCTLPGGRELAGPYTHAFSF